MWEKALKWMRMITGHTWGADRQSLINIYKALIRANIDQVCRWHISGRSHQQQRWNALQRGSGTAGWMVWCKQPVPQCKTKEVVMDFRQNSGDHPPLTIDSSAVERVRSTNGAFPLHGTVNSWGCTSKRTSPGPLTLHHSPRRYNSEYTFSTGWKEQVSLHPSSPLSTREPLRACWPAASLSDTGTVVQQTARPSSRQWTHLQRSSVPLSPPSWTFSLHDAPVKPIVSWRTPPILPTVSSSSYHQEDGSGASVLELKSFSNQIIKAQLDFMFLENKGWKEILKALFMFLENTGLIRRI